MIDFSKFHLDNEEIEFINDIKEDINNQNEILLEYKGYSFCIEPSGQELTIVDSNGLVGEYDCFDDFLLNHKIDGKPFIEILKELEYSE